MATFLDNQTYTKFRGSLDLANMADDFHAQIDALQPDPGLNEHLGGGAPLSSPDLTTGVAAPSQQSDSPPTEQPISPPSSTVPPAVSDFPAAPVLATPSVLQPARRGDLVPNQFASGLSYEDALAACGPVAAVALARAYGNDIPVQAALDAAKRNGWTQGGGMNGVSNQKSLLEQLGIATHLTTSPTEAAIAQDAASGNPVTISTLKHYYVANDYNPATHQFYVGQSGLAFKMGGGQWMTLDQIKAQGGGINGALFVDNPTTPTPSIANLATGGGDLSGHGPAPEGSATTAPAANPLETLANDFHKKIDDLGSAAGQVKDTAQSTLQQLADDFHQKLSDSMSAVGQGASDATQSMGEGLLAPAKLEQAGQQETTGAVGNYLTEPQPWMQNVVAAQGKQMAGEELTPQEQYAQARGIATGLAQTVVPEDILARSATTGAGSLAKSAEVAGELATSRQRAEGINPFALFSEAGPDRTPLTLEQAVSHLDDLNARHAANDARINQLEAQLHGGDFGSTGVVRPPGTTGWTDNEVVAYAKQNGLNPYSIDGWPSGRGDAASLAAHKPSVPSVPKQTPAQARAELTQLRTENEQIAAAAEHAMENGNGPWFRAEGPSTEALPWDYNAPSDAASTSAAGENATGANARGGAPDTRAAPQSARAAPAARTPATPAQPELAQAQAAVDALRAKFPQMSEGSLAASGAGKRLAAAQEAAANVRPTTGDAAMLEPEIAATLPQPQEVQSADLLQAMVDRAKARGVDPATLEGAQQRINELRGSAPAVEAPSNVAPPAAAPPPPPPSGTVPPPPPEGAGSPPTGGPPVPGKPTVGDIAWGALAEAKKTLFSLSNFHVGTIAQGQFYGPAGPQGALQFVGAYAKGLVKPGGTAARAAGDLAEWFQKATDAGALKNAGVNPETGTAAQGVLSPLAQKLAQSAGGGLTSGVAANAAAKNAGASDEDAFKAALFAGGIGAVLGPTAAIRMHNALWTEAVPLAKVLTFKAAVKGGASPEEAALFTKNLVGGQNLQAVAGQTGSDLARLLFMAPDWLWSQAKLIRDAGIGATKSVPGVENLPKMGGKMTGSQQLSRDWLLKSVGTGLLATEALQLAFTGHFTDQNQSGNAFKLEVGNQTYSLFPGNIQGELDLLSNRDPGKFVENRLGIAGTAGNVIANQQYPGSHRTVFPPGAAFPEQAKDVTGYALSRYASLGMTAPQQQYNQGAPLPAVLASALAGLRVGHVGAPAGATSGRRSVLPARSRTAPVPARRRP